LTFYLEHLQRKVYDVKGALVMVHRLHVLMQVCVLWLGLGVGLG